MRFVSAKISPIMFRFIFIFVVASIYYYLGHQLTQYAEISTWAQYSIWAWLLLIFAFFLFLPFYFWRSREKEVSSRLKKMMRLSHRVLAYLNFLLPLVLMRDLLGFIAGVVMGQDLAWLYSAEASLALLALPFLFKAWGGFVILRGPQVVRHEISHPRVHSDFSGMRILQISDLHISPFLKEGFVDQVVEICEKVNPDLVVMTGDIVDGPVEDHQEEIAKLAQLKSKKGAYFVPGNHEYYWGFAKIQKALEKAGVQSLHNQVHSLKSPGGEILLAGVPDPTGKHFGDEGPKWDVFEKHFNDRQFRILLSHQPHLADRASEVGFHFQLSGHTHGGQFFPWNLLIGFFQKYPKGDFRVGPMHLYVNQGTAYWGPAVRIGTHCELTEIVLLSQSRED